MSDSLKLYKSKLTEAIKNQCFMIKHLLSPSHLLTVVISIGNPNIIIILHYNISIDSVVQKRTGLVWSMRFFFFSGESKEEKVLSISMIYSEQQKHSHGVSSQELNDGRDFFLKGKTWKSKCRYWQSQQSPERCVSIFLSYKCLCMSVFAFELLLLNV